MSEAPHTGYEPALPTRNGPGTTSQEPELTGERLLGHIVNLLGAKEAEIRTQAFNYFRDFLTDNLKDEQISLPAAFSHGLTHDSLHVRAYTVRALARLTENPTNIPLLTTSTTQGELMTIIDAPSPSKADKQRDSSLKYHHPQSRIAAISTLSHLWHYFPEANQVSLRKKFEQLANVSREKQADIRLAAIRAIDHIGPNDSAFSLLLLLQRPSEPGRTPQPSGEPHRHVYEAIVAALQRTNSLEAGFHFMHQYTEAEFIAFLNILATIDTGSFYEQGFNFYPDPEDTYQDFRTEAAEWLTTVARNQNYLVPSWRMRIMAANLLEKHATAKQLPDLLKILYQEYDPIEEVCIGAIKAIFAICDREKMDWDPVLKHLELIAVDKLPHYHHLDKRAAPSVRRTIIESIAKHHVHEGVPLLEDINAAELDRLVRNQRGARILKFIHGYNGRNIKEIIDLCQDALDKLQT